MKDLVFFLKLFKPYNFWLASGIFLSLVTSLASISLLTLSGWFITSSAIAGLLAPDGVAIAFNFMQPAAEIRALAIIRTLGRYAERVVTHEATFKVLAEIRSWFFAKLIPLAPGHLANKQSADLLHSITQDIDALDALYLRLCSPIIIALLGGGLVVGFIAYYSVYLSVIVLLALLITAVIIPWIFNRLGQGGAEKITEQTVKFKVEQIEILQNITELSAFNAYTRFKKQLLHTSEQMITTQRSNNKLSALSTALTLFLSQLTVVVSLVVAAWLFQQQSISGAVLVMLVFTVLAVFELVMPLSSAMQMLAKTQMSAKRIRDIADLKPLIIEPEQPKEINTDAGISIKNLSFRYSDQSPWVLNNINLEIPQGSKIAIVGESGAGKSTLLQLIMRFYDPQQGSIKHSGIDYQQLASDKLMQQFSVLSQRTELFATTIKQNLLIAKPSASDDEITLAIKKAGLNKFIKQLPDGLNTWIGEHGSKVSGGEARRIALARVYLKDAAIILLDEPTEGLDKATELDVLNALEKIAENKTVIMVTHREAGLKLVDTVYKLEQGGLHELSNLIHAGANFS